MPSSAEISGRLSVLYQSFKHSLPAAQMLCLSCALSSSHLFHLSLPLLSLMRAFGPSGLCGSVLSLCMRVYLLQRLSKSVSHILSHTHTRTSQLPLSPWPYLLWTTLCGANVSDSSFQRRHCSPQQLPHTLAHIIARINASQCQIRTKTAARVEST